MPRRIVIAEHLRRYTNISKVKTSNKGRVSRDAAEVLFEERKKEFMEAVFQEHELEKLLLQVVDTAKKGGFQLEVMEFPSAYCTDGGRAINNSEKSWPKTLQGKAKVFHTLWKEHGQPNGYRLRARVNNYPQGFIGDVSLFIDWS